MAPCGSSRKPGHRGAWLAGSLDRGRGCASGRGEQGQSRGARQHGRGAADHVVDRDGALRLHQVHDPPVIAVVLAGADVERGEGLEARLQRPVSRCCAAGARGRRSLPGPHLEQLREVLPDVPLSGLGVGHGLGAPLREHLRDILERLAQGRAHGARWPLPRGRGGATGDGPVAGCGASRSVSAGSSGRERASSGDEARGHVVSMCVQVQGALGQRASVGSVRGGGEVWASTVPIAKWLPEHAGAVFDRGHNPITRYGIITSGV